MNKIEALKTTIEKIESGEYSYDWTNDYACNCGLVAKTVIGGKDIRDYGFSQAPEGPTGAVWTRRSHCMITGDPLPKVFQKLLQTGFSRTDLIELEYLSNVEIANRLWWTLGKNYEGIYYIAHFHYNKKSSLISYLQEWVRILEAEQPKTKEVIRYVSVPATITEQKLILS